MGEDRGFPARRASRFATTRWSVVVAAGQPQTTAHAVEALAGLCETYWYPAYAFVRRQGYGADDGADLTQEFFTRLLEKNFVHDADRTRGRFRAYLCSALRHFLANERDRAVALKRGGLQPPISIESETADGRYRQEPTDNLTPETLFDRRWALTLMGRALGRLREEYLAGGKTDTFDRLKGFLTGDESGRYQEAGIPLGMSEGAVKVAVHRLRRRFRDRLEAEIADTVSSPDEIDDEIAYLLKAVSG